MINNNKNPTNQKKKNHNKRLQGGILSAYSAIHGKQKKQARIKRL
jgi:hypothetical protein